MWGAVFTHGHAAVHTDQKKCLIPWNLRCGCWERNTLLFLSHHPSCPFLSSCFGWTLLLLICYFQNVSAFEALCREQMKFLVDVRCWHNQSLWPVGEWQCLPWRLASWKWQHPRLIWACSENVYCSFLPLKLMAWGLFPYRDCPISGNAPTNCPFPCSAVYSNTPFLFSCI